MTSTKNYNGIDILKLLCAILVVVVHLKPFSTYSDLLNYGLSNYFCRIAVPYFFIASGFFAFRKASADNFQFQSIVLYLKKIFRLYIIWTVIYLPLNVHGIYVAHPKGYFHSILVYIRDFIFVGSYIHLWYLNGLIISVLIVAFLLYKKVKMPAILTIAAVMYLSGLFLGQSLWGIAKPFLSGTLFWKLFHNLLVTSRNGWFFGFLFISIGADIAMRKKENRCSLKFSIIGFILSMALFFVEAMLVKKINLINYADMYIFMIPSSIFLFYIGLNIKFNDLHFAKHCRQLSSLIFYLHFLVQFFINKFYEICGLTILLNNSLIHFFSILLITIIISEIIMYISEKDKFNWLKNMYQ